MRLIWTSKLPCSEIQQVLTSAGHADVLRHLSDTDLWRITKRFPLLLSDSEGFVEEAFGFLFDVAFVRGSTRSSRTLSTYAESLFSWLSYAEQRHLQWRRPKAQILAEYRDHMLGTEGGDQGSRRALARRTVNLRLSVVIAFYEHIGCIQRPEEARPPAFPGRSFPGRDRSSSRLAFHRLRVRVYSRRPKALTADQCRALSCQLRLPHRLVWQWALCTGLRTCSLVRITLRSIYGLRQRAPTDRTIDVLAKGGRMVSAHVPEALLRATEMYIDTDRVLAAGRRAEHNEEALFLNCYGRPLSSKAFYRALKRACRRLQFTSHPHQARTSFATYVRDGLEALNRKGHQVDAVKVVQSLLAHADARTTEQYLESIDVPSLDVLAVLEQLANSATLGQSS